MLALISGVQVWVRRVRSLEKLERVDPASNQSKEEPHIQREIDSNKTGTIRRYLRLADNLLKKRGDDPSSEAA